MGHPAPARAPARVRPPRARPGRARRRRLRRGLRPRRRPSALRARWAPTPRRRCGPRSTWSTRPCTPDATARRGPTPTPCDEPTSAASRRGSRSSPRPPRRWSPPTTRHRTCSFGRWQLPGSRSGRSSSHGCDSRTANACDGCVAHVTLEASSPLPAKASSGSVRVRGRNERRPSSAATGATRSASRGRRRLTHAQEREIALLAATGLTNRQIADPAVRVAANRLGPPVPDLPQARHHVAGGPAGRTERDAGAIRHLDDGVARSRAPPARQRQSND